MRLWSGHLVTAAAALLHVWDQLVLPELLQVCRRVLCCVAEL
jgi:hypothetical protein